MRYLLPQTLVVPSASNQYPALRVARDEDILDKFCLPDKARDLHNAGWQVAEFANTGHRMFVRVSGEARWLAAWSEWVVTVERAEVLTVTEYWEGEPSICADLGEKRPGRRWIARLDRTESK